MISRVSMAILATAAVGVVPLSVTAGTSARTAASTHSSAHVVVTTSAKERAALNALRNVRIGAPANTTGSPSLGPDAIPGVTSQVWSGYADVKTSTTTGKYLDVTADWHVPQIAEACTATAGEQLAAFWVGIDGDGSSPVEQTGTLTECFQGSPFYFDWYELFPGPIEVESSVNPAELISATVRYTGGGYFLSLVDVTQQRIDVSTLQPCGASSCPGNSAEVVAEAPQGCVQSSQQACRSGVNGDFLMPDFGYVSFFTAADATFNDGGGLGSSIFGPNNITMVNSKGNKLADVSSLLTHDGFIVTWLRAG